jgi:hypothetical protein
MPPRVAPAAAGWPTTVAAIERGEEVNEVIDEGAASSVDLDEYGDVVTGTIRLRQIADGKIVTREVRGIDLSA